MNEQYTEKDLQAAQEIGEAFGVTKERDRIEFLFKAYQQYFPFDLGVLIRIINDENIGRVMIQEEENMFREERDEY